MSLLRSLSVAYLAICAALPASAQVRFGDQLEAIRFAGSENMMVHALSARGLPVQARLAREKILAQMAMRGDTGDVSRREFSVSPVLAYDPNINGGYANDGFTVAGIPFTISKEHEAVGGLLLGVGAAGRARVVLGTDTGLALTASGTFGYAPDHDMSKIRLGASACVNHMIDYSTFGHVCLETSWRDYALGETSRNEARVGVSRVFGSDLGLHEAGAELTIRRTDSGDPYTQAIAGLTLTSALPGPLAIRTRLEVGEEVEGVLAMRERAVLGLGFPVFGRQSSVSVAVQSDRGGRWLGEDLTRKVTSFGIGHRVSNKLRISASFAGIDASADFFDDTRFGLNLAVRF